MTHNIRESTAFKVVGFGAIALLMIGVWMFLSDAFFLAFNNRNQNDASLLSLFQYWRYFQSTPHEAVPFTLYLAMGVSGVVIFVPSIWLAWPAREKLHGDAKWAKTGDVDKAGLLTGEGIIVGQFKGRYLTHSSTEPISLTAPTRSGKGQGVVLPNAVNWGESFVSLDPKEEIFEHSAGFRKKHGQAVYLFNPAARDYRTHRYNPLSYISDDPNLRIDDIQKIALFICPDAANDSHGGFFTTGSRSLFLGIVLYLMETPGEPVTLGNVVRHLKATEGLQKWCKRIVAERRRSDPLTPVCERELMSFANGNDKTTDGFKSGLEQALALLVNPLTDAATSDNDFDLRDLRKKKMSIYVVIKPESRVQVAPILRLFFQQLVDLNTRELPEKNPALKYKCLLLLDEFTSVGKVPAIADGISYMAGYNLLLFTITQSPSQLREVYGENQAQTFENNMGLYLIYTPAAKDNKTAKEVSEMLGNKTITNRSFSKKALFGGSGGGGGSVTESESGRELLKPQEVKMLPLKNQIIFKGGHLPIKCDKIVFRFNKELAARVLPPPKVPLITVVVEAAPEALPDIVAELSSTETMREITADDLAYLDQLAVDDFAVNLDEIQIPKGEPISDSEMEDLVDSFFNAVTEAKPA